MKRGTLILLVLFAACQPHFKSGTTLCSDKGECPDGYLCSDDGQGSAFTCITRPSVCADTAGFYCAASGTCWASVAACTTVTNCGTATAPVNYICSKPGTHPDCNGTKCLPNSTVTDSDGGFTGTGGNDAAGSGLGVPDAAALDVRVPDARVPDVATGGVAGSGGILALDALADLRVPDTAAPMPDARTPDAATPDAPVPDARVPDAATPDLRTPDTNTPTCPAPAAGGTCNVFPSCGCQAGQVCAIDTPATGLACYPSGGLAEGVACTGQPCGEGLGCFGGICRKYCQAATDCVAVDSAQNCLSTYWQATSATIPGVSVCARVCDPVAPQHPRSPLLACPAGLGCVPAPGPPGASNCIPQPGTGIADSPCSKTTDCVPGFYCSSWYACTKFCSTSADCAIGYTCYPFSPVQYAGTTEVGYCD